MQLYRFSPITREEKLFEAIRHIHVESNTLCHTLLGKYFPNSGNIGVFCHYENEYDFLTQVREQLTESSENPNQKYFQLHNPIVIEAIWSIPETLYTHLYIRKPDPYRHQAGDIDLFLEQDAYKTFKEDIQSGKMSIDGVRIFPRADLDMIELFHPDSDVLVYISTDNMTARARVKQT